MPKHRFEVIEYSSGYAVRDRVTGEEAWMGDGVDTLYTRSGQSMYPGSEYFRKTWQRVLNSSDVETLEAYFPEQFEKEKMDYYS